MSSTGPARPGKPWIWMASLLTSQLPPLSQDADRHQLVANSFLRRPCLDDAP